MKNKGLIAVAIITPWIAVIILAAILITGNLSNKTTPTPTETASASVETVSTPAATEPSVATEPRPTTASEPTVTTEPTTSQTEPTTAQTEPTTVQTEPTTESTQATTEPYIDHTHAWDEGTVTKKVSYTENGEITYRCVDCGATKTESVPMLKVEVEVVEEWDTPKLGAIRKDFYLTLEDGTRERFRLLVVTEYWYIIPEHISYKSLSNVNNPESTGIIEIERFVKGDDGKYYKYVSGEDKIRPGRTSLETTPEDTEVLTDTKDYEGYVLIHCYSSKGEDLGYTIKIDTVWKARMSESDFS